MPTCMPLKATSCSLSLPPYKSTCGTTDSSFPCSSIPLERDVYRFRVLVEEVGDQLTEYVKCNTRRCDDGGDIDGENSLGGGSSSSSSSRIHNRLAMRVFLPMRRDQRPHSRVSKPAFPSFLDTRLVPPLSPLSARKARSRLHITSCNHQNQRNLMLRSPPVGKSTDCSSCWRRLGVNSKT